MREGRRGCVTSHVQAVLLPAGAGKATHEFAPWRPHPTPHQPARASPPASRVPRHHCLPLCAFTHLHPKTSTVHQNSLFESAYSTQAREKRHRPTWRSLLAITDPHHLSHFPTSITKHFKALWRGIRLDLRFINQPANWRGEGCSRRGHNKLCRGRCCVRCVAGASSASQHVDGSHPGGSSRA